MLNRAVVMFMFAVLGSGLIGCVTQSEYDKLVARVEVIEKTDVRGNLTELKKALEDQKADTLKQVSTAENKATAQVSESKKTLETLIQGTATTLEGQIKDGDEKSSNLTKGVETGLKDELKALDTRLTAVQGDAAAAKTDATAAKGVADTTSKDLAGFRADVKTLHEGYIKTVKDARDEFQTKVTGVENIFGEKVKNLETQLTGAEAKLSAAVDKKVADLLVEVQKSQTLLLGKLQENKEAIDKAVLENRGFSAELTKAKTDLDTMRKGFEATVAAKVTDMNTTYTGLRKQFDDLTAVVKGYGTQLERVRIAIVGIIGEIKEPPKNP